MRSIRILFVLLMVGFALSGCRIVNPKQTDSPVAGGIFPPLQDPAPNVRIIGTRASAGWARHDLVYGLDTGFIGNITDKDFFGAAASGIFHSTNGKAVIIGFQLSGVTNLNYGKTHLAGLQLALGVNYAGGENRVYGIQLAGLGNYGGRTKIYGFQIGLYNEAESVFGLQLGVLNKTKNLHGVQLGVLNIATENWLPAFVGINVGF